MITIITIGSWIIPLFIALVSIVWVLFYVKNTDGMGLVNFIVLISILFVSFITCIIWGIFK